jgi:hypothetical protein
MRTEVGHIVAAAIAQQIRKVTADREPVDVVAALRLVRRCLVSTGAIDRSVADAAEREVDLIAEHFEAATNRKAGG